MQVSSQQSSIPVIQNPQFLHFKNAVYNGIIANNRRQGVGVILLDSSILVICKQKADQLINSALVWLSYDTYFIGQFNKNALDGPFVIRSPNIVIYSSMNMNSVAHDVMVINKGQRRARLWNIQNNQGFCAKQIQINQFDTQLTIIKNLAPYVTVIPSAIDFLKKQFGKQLGITQLNITNMNNLIGNSSQMIKNNNNKKQFWIELKGGNSSKKLGFKIYNGQLLTCGISQNMILNGLGFKRQGLSQQIFNSGVYYQGQFTKNRLNGQGAKQDNTKTLYGTFSHGDIRSVITLTQETENVKSLLIKLKRKIHIHSLQFTNSYINERPFMLMLDFLRIIEEQEGYDSVKKNNQSEESYEAEEVRQKFNNSKAKQNFQSKSSFKSALQKYQSERSKYNHIISARRKQKIDELSYNLSQYNAINNALKYRK